MLLLCGFFQLQRLKAGSVDIRGNGCSFPGTPPRFGEQNELLIIKSGSGRETASRAVFYEPCASKQISNHHNTLSKTGGGARTRIRV